MGRWCREGKVVSRGYYDISSGDVRSEFSWDMVLDIYIKMILVRELGYVYIDF